MWTVELIFFCGLYGLTSHFKVAYKYMLNDEKRNIKGFSRKFYFQVGWMPSLRRLQYVYVLKSELSGGHFQFLVTNW